MATNVETRDCLLVHGGPAAPVGFTNALLKVGFSHCSWRDSDSFADHLGAGLRRFRVVLLLIGEEKPRLWEDPLARDLLLPGGNALYAVYVILLPGTSRTIIADLPPHLQECNVFALVSSRVLPEGLLRAVRTHRQQALRAAHGPVTELNATALAGVAFFLVALAGVTQLLNFELDHVFEAWGLGQTWDEDTGLAFTVDHFVLILALAFFALMAVILHSAPKLVHVMGLALFVFGTPVAIITAWTLHGGHSPAGIAQPRARSYRFGPYRSGDIEYHDLPVVDAKVQALFRGVAARHRQVLIIGSTDEVRLQGVRVPWGVEIEYHPVANNTVGDVRYLRLSSGDYIYDNEQLAALRAYGVAKRLPPGVDYEIRTESGAVGPNSEYRYTRIESYDDE